MKTKWMVQAVVVMCCLGLAFGCATGGGGTAAAKPAPAAGGDDRAAVAKALMDWSGALKAKNIDQIMGFYSDSFKDDEGRDKAGIKELIEGAIANGYLDGAAVDLASAQVTVTGDAATVSPVQLSGDMGAISLSVSLKKEAGKWVITSSGQA